jgi:hypothetical protein
MTPTIAYLAEGKLYTKRPDHSPQLIDSPFVQQMLDRVQRTRERHEWKNQGMGWRVGAGGLAGMMGGGGVPAEVRRVRFSGLTRGGKPGELLYALDTDHVGGLFSYDTAEQYERRLYHRNQFRAANLSRHPADGMLAVSLRAEDGSAHVATMNADGRGISEVTEGDAVDEAPAWAAPRPDAATSKVLVFQSAGIGRNAGGMMVGLGPYAIQKLDLDAGDLSTLLEEEGHDLLLPRLLADGSLLFIRRPYEPRGAAVSPLKVARDIVLFPIGLVIAIVHFLNWFSHVFARRPLITAGGPPKEGPEARYLMLWGKMVDAEKAMAAKPGEARALVPPTWQLVRRAGGGGEKVLARGVLSFDVAEDGSIVYTSGGAVYHLPTGGTAASELCRGKMIEHVSVVG